MYRALMRFLGTLEIPILTTLRDSQNYVRAAETGVGVFEMKPYLVREDLEQWLPLIGWLAQKDSGAARDIAAPTPQSAPSIVRIAEPMPVIATAALATSAQSPAIVPEENKVVIESRWNLSLLTRRN